MRTFWPFRNFTNFSLTAIGLTGAGLLYASISNERVFSNSPIVHQAIKILGSNNQIRNLLGNPIMYSGSFSNTYNISDKQQYYNFQVKGSKNQTSTQVNSVRIKVSQLNDKIRKVNQLQKQIQSKNEEINKNIQQMKKMTKKQKYAQEQKINVMRKQMKQLNTQLENAQIDKVVNLRKFYIPDQDLILAVTRNKNPQNLVSEDKYLYGIDGLVANLPNRSTITIISPLPSTQTSTLTSPSKLPQVSASSATPANTTIGPTIIPTPSISNNTSSVLSNPVYTKQLSKSTLITQSYLRQRLNQGLQSLSQSQIQNYGRHKTMMMYGKYNNYRMGFMLLVVFGAVMGFSAWNMFKLKAVTGTIIAYQAENYFFKHPRTIQLMRILKKSKNNVKFSRTIQGGKRDRKFDCIVDVQGLPGGKIYFQGIQQGKSNVKFRKFVLEYRQGNGEIKKIDLLV